MSGRFSNHRRRSKHASSKDSHSLVNIWPEASIDRSGIGFVRLAAMIKKAPRLALQGGAGATNEFPHLRSLRTSSVSIIIAQNKQHVSFIACSSGSEPAFQSPLVPTRRGRPSGPGSTSSQTQSLVSN